MSAARPLCARSDRRFGEFHRLFEREIAERAFAEGFAAVAEASPDTVHALFRRGKRWSGMGE